MKELDVNNYEFFVTVFKSFSDAHKCYFILDKEGNWYNYNSDTKELQKIYTHYLNVQSIRNPVKDYQLIKIKATQAVDSNLAVEKIKEMSENCICYGVERVMREKKMNENYTKVKVVPKSEKYTRDDIETALAEAYEENGYVLDFMRETDKYIILYLKEKDL